ncbi:hypothetical protein [Brevibacillus thermoruber]|nr:hypothetical protein [Brevibacillus thermoruber]
MNHDKELEFGELAGWFGRTTGTRCGTLSEAGAASREGSPSGSFFSA